MEDNLPEVIVIGLGPAGPDLMSRQASGYLNQPIKKFVRTEHHLASLEWMESGAESLDFLYLESKSFDEVYTKIADTVIDAALSHGRVIYCVPGSPLIMERSVEIIRQAQAVRTTIVHSMSFLDLAYERLGIDPIMTGLSLLDSSVFQKSNLQLKTPALIGQCWNLDIMSDIKLAILEYETEGHNLADAEAVILHHLGHDDELIEYVAVKDLDKSVAVDHLSCVYLPFPDGTLGDHVNELLTLTKILREECPWDKKQTHSSLGRHLLEETYEVLDAINDLSHEVSDINNDLQQASAEVGEGLGSGGPISAIAVSDGQYERVEHLREELGDLLVQIFFHAVIADEKELFDIKDIISTVCKKLIRRHPHVFPSDKVALTPFLSNLLDDVLWESQTSDQGLFFQNPNTPSQVEGNWEQIKKKEKQRDSIFDGIPPNLPALLYVTKLERKLRSIDLGFAPDEANMKELAKSFSDLTSGEISQAGLLLLNLSRYMVSLGLDPENITRQAALDLEAYVKTREIKGDAK